MRRSSSVCFTDFSTNDNITIDAFPFRKFELFPTDITRFKCASITLVDVRLTILIPIKQRLPF